MAKLSKLNWDRVLAGASAIALMAGLSIGLGAGLAFAAAPCQAIHEAFRFVPESGSLVAVLIVSLGGLQHYIAKHDPNERSPLERDPSGLT